MDDVTALRRLIRTARYNPDNLEKRLQELCTVWTRMFVDGGKDTLEPFLDMLNEEADKFLAHQDNAKGQKADGPTRQTARNLREDPVLLLLSRGTIDKEDQVLIEQIREIRFKLAMGLTPGGSDLSGERVDTSRKGFIHPIERLSTAQQAIYTHVYKPWADQENAHPVCLGKRGRVLGLTPLGLVVAVIEDSTSLTRLEERHKVRNGTLTEPFKTAIAAYAKRLGVAKREGKV